MKLTETDKKISLIQKKKSWTENNFGVQYNSNIILLAVFYQKIIICSKDNKWIT